VDWWELPTADVFPVLRANPKVTLALHDRTGFIGTMRLNHLTPPFDNPAIRRALLGAIDQDDYMSVVGGNDPAMRRTGVGYFCPISPMAADSGASARTGGPDYAKVRDAIRAAGYAGERIQLIGASDSPAVKAITEVGYDMLSRAGFNVELLLLDVVAEVSHLMRMDPYEKGGWNAFYTYWSGIDQWDPAVHTYLRGTGRNGRPGWPESPRLEALRSAWLFAPGTAEQKRIAAEIQAQAYQDIPYIPVGQWLAPMAYKREITGVLDGYPLFWNVRRA
jgi:peptide/nickel transport system substrate-binding protein